MSKKKKITIVSVTLVLIAIALYLFIGLLSFIGWGPFIGVEESHTVANVPDETVFDKYLARDLSLFASEEFNLDEEVDYYLLSDDPNQIGIAYPRYYVWLSFNGVEGVAEIAAREKSFFDVVNFFTTEDIITDPRSVCEYFPEDICEEVKQRATE